MILKNIEFTEEFDISKIILLLFFWLSSYAFEAVEVLNPDIHIEKSLYFTTDKNLSAYEAYEFSKNEKLTPLPKEALSFGFDNKTYWYMFEITITNRKKDYFLDLKHTVDEFAWLYTFEDEKLIRTQESGYALAPKHRSVNSIPVRFELHDINTTVCYLLKVQSNNTQYAAFSFGSSDSLAYHWHILYSITLITFGVFLALSLYNAFLYIVIRDKTYLFYIVYTFGLMFYTLTDTGLLAPFYFFIQSDINTNLVFFKVIELTGLLFFSIYFLDLRNKNPSLYRYLLLFFIIFIAVLVLYMLDITKFLAVVFIYITTYLLIIIGFVSYYKGYKPALFYIIATGGGLIFINIFFLMPLGVMPLNLIGLNLLNFAIIWDMIALSLALAYRIKLLQKENQDKERILLLQSRQNSFGELSGNIAHQWRTPLAALASVLVNLEAKLKYSQIQKEDIISSLQRSLNLLKHLSDTVETFQALFQNTHTKEIFSVDDEIKKILAFTKESMQHNNITINYNSTDDFKLHGNSKEFFQAILNIILNAKDVLIDSSMQNPTISILLQRFQDGFTLDISDNGGGITLKPIDSIFDSYVTSKDHGIGIGLFITKMILEKKFNATIKAKNKDKGALFSVIFIKNDFRF